MKKHLPQDLTSYDLLKSLALVLMVIDHIGYYFYPDVLMWRVIGRLSVPIWFFLIGYAQSREVPRIWLLGGGALILSALAAGEYLFPLNILFTLTLARLCVDGLAMRGLQSQQALAGMVLLLFFLGFPSVIAVEYGTIGLLFTLFGFMRRHKGDLKLEGYKVLIFVTGISAAYIIHQSVFLPPMAEPHYMIFAAGMAVVMGLLYVFAPVTYPGLTRYGSVFLPVMKLLGRKTLEIYVLHILFLRGLFMVLDPGRFGFFDFQIAPPGLVSLFLMSGSL